jgi:hypothetical protein
MCYNKILDGPISPLDFTNFAKEILFNFEILLYIIDFASIFSET